MPEISSATDAVKAARSAVASDVATVAAAIEAAVADVDAQLTTLRERREDLQSALAAVEGEIAATDGQRTALVAARDQLPSPEQGAAPAPAPAPAAPDEAEGEWEYIEVTQNELDPAVPRTERIMTLLTKSQQELSAPDITDLLNSYGDSTTTKVVSGTMSNLAKRGAIVKTGPGIYKAT